MEELHTPQLTEFIEKYRRNWKQHVGRMGAERMRRKILKYQPKRKRSSGRPLKRWMNCHVAPVTDLKRPNTVKNDDDDDDDKFS
jgi:hypothetical protein